MFPVNMNSSDLPIGSFSLLNEISTVSLDSNDVVQDSMDDLQLIPSQFPLAFNSNTLHELHLTKANLLIFLKLLIELSSKSDLNNTQIDLLAFFPFIKQLSSQEESACVSFGFDSKSSGSHEASLKPLKYKNKRSAKDDSDLKKVSPFKMRITRSQFYKGIFRRGSLDENKSASAGLKSSCSGRLHPLHADFQCCEEVEFPPREPPLAHLSTALFGTVGADVTANYELLLTELWAASDSPALASCSASESNASATLPAAGESRIFTCLLVHWEPSLSQFLYSLLAEGPQIALGDLLLRALVHLAGEPYRRRAVEHLRPRSSASASASTPPDADAKEQREPAFDEEPEPLVELCTCVRFGNGSPHSALEQYERFLALYVELFELLESRQPRLFQLQSLELHSVEQLVGCLTAALAYAESLHLIRLLTSPPKTTTGITATQHYYRTVQFKIKDEQFLIIYCRFLYCTVCTEFTVPIASNLQHRRRRSATERRLEPMERVRGWRAELRVYLEPVTTCTLET